MRNRVPLIVALACGVVLAACSGASPSEPECRYPGDACLIDGACVRARAVSAADACLACIPSLSSTSWSTADDGTPCAAGVCSGGACVAAATTRTVELTFRTLYRPDDGSETEVEEPPLDGALPAAVLVADGSAEGYTSFPIDQIATSAYVATGVPVGAYYLRLDRSSLVYVSNGSAYPSWVASTATELVPLVRGDPDLSTVLGARPDLARVSSVTPVNVEVSDLEPWVSGSRLVAVSSQADAVKWAYSMVPPPSTGATSDAFTLDWSMLIAEPRGSGLPDPTKNDLVFWYQQTREPISSGPSAGFVRRATRYARLDAMHLEDGVPGSVAVPLVAAPQTGSIATSARGDLFAALAPEVNPAAAPLGITIAAVATPRSVSYPDAPSGARAQLFLLSSDATSAFDLGSFSYGQFLEPRWDEYRVVSYVYQVEHAAGLNVEGYIDALEPTTSPQPASAVPVLSPPRSPRINGADGFAFATGVGTQPVLSWSPPAIGSPSSYVVTIRALRNLQPGEVGELRATVFDATSFRVPPGFLTAGVTYSAVITARSAPWDVPQRLPFRDGFPRYTADCLTAEFQP